VAGFGYGKFVSIGYQILPEMSLDRAFDYFHGKSHVANMWSAGSSGLILALPCSVLLNTFRRLGPQADGTENTIRKRAIK
jgi:hypothetical protein